MKLILIFVSIYLAFVESGYLPVEKCNLEDDECMKTQFQNAIPTFMAGISEIGIPTLDVMELDDFKFDLSGLKFSLSDGRLKGLKNTIIDGVKWNLKKKTFRVYYHLDCTVKGHYTAGGRILILPITGDGDIKMKMKNAHLIFDVDYEIEKGDDGKDYLEPKKLNFDFDIKDNAQFHLTNLFNGNKELSDAMLIFLNENWKQISVEFGRPLIEAAAKIILRNLKTFFKHNPIAEIANL